MERDDYPFPVHEGPTIDVSDEQAAAYERTLVLLLPEWIEEGGGEAHGHKLISVSMVKPSVVMYRSPPR